VINGAGTGRPNWEKMIEVNIYFECLIFYGRREATKDNTVLLWRLLPNGESIDKIPGAKVWV
jgi:hypothetical protein